MTTNQRLKPMPGRSRERSLARPPAAGGERWRGGRATAGPFQVSVPDADRPEVARPPVGGQLLGDGDRAVVTAGAADGHGEPVAPLGDVGGDGEAEEVVGEGEEPLRRGLGEDEGAHRSGQAREGPQVRVVEGVLHETHVEDEVGLEGDAVLEAEADELEGDAPRLLGGAQRREDPLAQLAPGEVGGVDDDVGLLAHLIEDAPLLDDRGGDAGAALERMAVGRLAEAPDEHIVASLEEEDMRRDAPPLQCTEDRAERNARISRSDVEDDGHPLEASGLRREGRGAVRPSMRIVSSYRPYMTADMTSGLTGSPPGVTTTAKMTMPRMT